MDSHEQSDKMEVIRNDSMSPTGEMNQQPMANTHDHVDPEDMSSSKPGSTQLQAAVLTTLQNVSSDTLRSFLSPTCNTFKAIMKGDKQLVIWRKGLEVFVGTFEHHRTCKMYGFEHVAGFLIGYDGMWHLKVTASNAYSNPKWIDVWAGKFDSYGGLAKMTVDTEAVDMAKRASEFARSMLEGQYWEAKADIKTT